MNESFERSRRISDQELLRKGAEKLADGRIEVTRGQIKHAKREMMKDLNSRIVSKIDNTFKVEESETFESHEIENAISRTENIDRGDITLTNMEIDNVGNIVSMSFHLRDDLAYDKFGKDVTYFFELKGKFPKGKPVYEHPITGIWRYSETTTDTEHWARLLKSAILGNKQALQQMPKYICIAKFENGSWVTEDLEQYNF